jgi:hypothetical protein
MQYRNAKRLKNGFIDCEIEHPDYGWIPFTCDPSDIGAAINTADLHAQMDADPLTKPYIPPTQEEIDAQAADDVRAERDRRLALEVDPIASNALRWSALTDEQQQAWANYRQALLDVTQQSGFPSNVAWPVKPE